MDPTIEVSPDTSYICKIYGQGDTDGRVTITVSMPEYGVPTLKKMSQTEDDFAVTRNLLGIWKLDCLSNRMPSVTIHEGTPEFEKYQNEIEQEYERVANLTMRIE